MKIIDFIVCDDIRNEVNNKVSLIGIYNDAINFIVPANSSWPKILQLGLFIRLDFENDNEYKNIGKLEILSKINEEVIFQISQNLTNNEQDIIPRKRMIISVVLNQVNINKPGDMELSLKVYNINNEITDTFYYPENIKIVEIVQKM